MEIGDLVARRWPTLNGPLKRLIGVVVEKKPLERSEAFVLVKWSDPYRIVEKVRENELEILNENR